MRVPRPFLIVLGIPALAAVLTLGLTSASGRGSATPQPATTWESGRLAGETTALPAAPDDGDAARALAEPEQVDAPRAVAVQGNRLVDAAGRTVRLLGVNRSGAQYACVEGWGVFDGPVDDDAVAAMAAWHMNAVRVPLNEHCWLGINVPAAYSGATYRAEIAAFVERLVAHGLYVVLDLHWNAPGGTPAMEQQPMADRDHAPAFWRSVAETFAGNPAVVFDLYNEPYPDGNQDTVAAWACVRDGGTCPGVPFEAAGSQELLDAVRSTGAPNVVLVAGPQYAGSLTRWEEFAPHDPLRQLAASVHVYRPDWSPCAARACWESVIAPLAARVPVVMGEIGIANSECSSRPIEPLMDFADAHGISYLAWAWVVSSCTDEPSLILDYSGVPTPYGLGLQARLLRLHLADAEGG